MIFSTILAPAGCMDVTVTAAGQAKLEKLGEDATVKLRPGKDYKLKPTCKNGRVQYAAQSGTLLQHGWYLQQRPRPHVPCFSHCPVPARLDENVNENARLTLAYFRAWTLDSKRGTDAVPHVQTLRGVDESWEQALRRWLRRLPCEETKQYIGNFMSVYRVRPAVDGQENSDDDAADTALHVTPTEIADALQTKLSSHGKKNQAETKDATDGLMAEALRTGGGVGDGSAGNRARSEDAECMGPGASGGRNTCSQAKAKKHRTQPDAGP